jgi:predicted double-glycine peptidase
LRKYFAPEVVQTSNMDCGPAALKCLLEGFGIHASYERLREACQTSVDGTSIDAVEVVAGQLGLEAEQILVPADHVFLPNARSLPAIVVLRLPGGLTHFVVAWRKHGRLIQVMDPAVGRRWVSVTRLRSELYRHAMTVPAADWFEFARSEEFQHPLRSRLHSCGVRPSEAEQFISRSLAEATWRGLATLDAALRLLTSLIESGALPARPATASVLKKFCLAPQLVPESFWSVREAESDGDCETVVVRGVVIVRVAGRSTQPVPDDIGKELSAAIAERPLSPARALVQFLKPGGLISSVLLVCGLLPIAFGLLVEAILFRGLFDVSAQLGIAGQRMGAMAAVVLFSAILLLLEFSAFTGVARISRLIETACARRFFARSPG